MHLPQDKKTSYRNKTG